MKKEITSEDYYKKARQFASQHQVTVSEHIIDVMASVMMTRDGFQMGGSFVTAVVNNKLYEAIGRADNDCLNNIKIIALCSKDCFINY